MKRVIIVLVIALATAQSASADVYVKVDANGNAIGGAIMCDAATCGAGSLYSSLTLNPGESYVLQGIGVHHGIGNNNPGVDVKHEATSNEWVVTNNNAPAPIVERFTVYTPEPVPVIQEPVTVTPVDTKTVIVETPTAVIETVTALIDTSTATITNDFDWSAFWVQFEIWFKTFFAKFWGVKP
jgi:hypothetical protein